MNTRKQIQENHDLLLKILYELLQESHFQTYNGSQYSVDKRLINKI